MSHSRDEMNSLHYHGKHIAMAAAALLIAVGGVRGKGKPKFLIPDDTLSPDHRYGVTVPIFDFNETNDLGNNLVEVSTGRVLAVINAATGYDRALNFREVLPSRWSPDGSVLLWEVAGKWMPNALVLLKIEKGKSKWQVDLLTTAQQAILGRVRKAAQTDTSPQKRQTPGTAPLIRKVSQSM